MTVTEHVGLEGLAALEPDWLRLLRSLPEPEYHLDYGWAVSYVRHAFHPAGAPRFFAIREDGGRALAIFPLEHRTDRLRSLPVAMWALMGSKEVDPVPFAHSADFLCESEARAPEAVGALRRHLARARPAAGVLLLGRFTQGSNAWAARVQGRHRSLPSHARGGFHVIPVGRTYEELLNGLSRKFRRSLRSRADRLGRMGPLDYEVVANGEDRFPRAYEDFLRVESSGWKGPQGHSSALRFRHTQRSFLEELMASSGNLTLEIHRLVVNGKAAAGQIWLRSGTSLVNMKVGYDEEFREYGPGHLLLGEVLRRACGDPGVTRVSMLTRQAWHEDWAPEYCRRYWQYFPLPTWRAALPLALFQVPQRVELRRRLFQTLGRHDPGLGEDG